MFDIGGPELFFLLILALLIFGPRRLPQIGKQLGGFVAQMRHAMRDMQGTLEREVALEDVKGALNEVKGIQGDASTIARELAGFGPPPYVDPNRRRELAPAAAGPDAAGPDAASPDAASAAPDGPAAASPDAAAGPAPASPAAGPAPASPAAGLVAAASGEAAPARPKAAPPELGAASRQASEPGGPEQAGTP